MANLRRRRVASAAIGLVALLAEDEQQQQAIPRKLKKVVGAPYSQKERS